MPSFINIVLWIANSFNVLLRSSAAGLIILLIATFAELVLAITVIQENRKSATNLIFFFLSIFTILWLIVAYLFGLPRFSGHVLLLARLAIFFAAPTSLLFFWLAYAFPGEHLDLKSPSIFFSGIVTVIMMGLNISPYAFTSQTRVVNGVVHLVSGFGLFPFSIFSTIFCGLAIYWLVKKYRMFAGNQHEQVRTVFWGMSIMLGLIILTILIPILASGSATFIALAPIYTLVFLAMTAYAIVRYGLFNMKVIATQGLTVAIWITLLSNIFVAGNFAEAVIQVFVFLATVVLGIMLIGSVQQEVRQREEMEKLDKELEKKNGELESLSRFKSQLLSLASHQIRSPLAAMKGFLSLVVGEAYGKVDEKAKVALRKVSASADDLIELINELLDVRKVEEGKMDYHFEKVDLAEIGAKVIDMLNPLAGAKGLSLEMKFQREPVYVSADGQKIQQVVQNFIDNSIKYTPSGSISVDIKKEGGKAIFSVVDTGLGLPADLIPSLFEEFIRDERVKKEIRGTGLGLFIARKITEAHGGKVWAQSEGEGKGSSFYFSIPLL